MTPEHLDHALNGQVPFNGAGTFTGPFYGLNVESDVVVGAMTWQPAYATKCTNDDGVLQDWTVFTKLNRGYHPGRIQSITITSGEGTLYRL